ncbi:MAG: hypothetical protein Q8K78_05295 [Planctomycetaceae bacterium]|nr:hypothetical protein [Planctomycetaceae bacterium]
MRTATIRAAGDFVLAGIQKNGPTLLSGLALGFAVVALGQQAAISLGTDPGVQFGLWLGIGSGALWGLSSRTTGRWSHTADWLYLAAVLALWPLWLTSLVDGLGWLPVEMWQSPTAVNGIGVILGLLAAMVPAALITKLASASTWFASGLPVTTLQPKTLAERVAHHHHRQMLCFGSAFAAGILLQTFIFGTKSGVFWPALIIVGVCTAISAWQSVRRGSGIESRGIETAATPVSTASPWATLCSSLFLGVALGSVPQWLAELWPVTAVTTNLTLAVAVIGAVLARTFGSSGVTTRFATATVTVTCTFLLCLSSVSVNWVLWQNATFTTWWQWETVRTASLFLVWGSLGACVAWQALALNRNATQTVGWCGTAIGLGACLALWAIGPQFGPRTGLAIAALGGLLCHGISLISIPSSSRRWSWSLAGSMTAAMCLCVWQYGIDWNSERASRLLFSTTAVLAHRSGWEPRLLERLDDTRLVTSFTGRSGAWTVWKNKGGEWHLRENGVPVGAISLAPAWYPQFAPEAAAALWPLVLVDQPERVLMLGAGSGAALRTCSAFPVREVICHEADVPLIRFIQGPLAAASGYDPFADRCRWIPQPAEWLALPDKDQYDIIVSSPRMAAQQAHLICYTAEYYRRAARHLSEQGVFCQRFSGVDLGPKPLLSACMAMQQAFAETACVEVSAGEYLLLGAASPQVLVRDDLAARWENRAAEVASVLNWDWSYPLNLPAYDGAALKEAADELHVGPHSAYRTGFAFVAPYEMMRWGAKLQETAMVLSKRRTSAPRFPLPTETGEPQSLVSVSKSRKVRYLEWLGAAGENPEVLRRLSEYMGEQKLVREYPDTHWWEYRKILREQLQDHPRTTLQQVKYTTDSPGKWHSEDSRRKGYFEVLGELANDEQAELPAYQSLDSLLEPHDPLLSLFGHQELAELLSRRNKFPADERRHRLHAIYYAPSHDASVRNVVLAIDRLATLPDPELSGAQRFDELNGLLQTLRGRWEARNQRPLKAAQVTLQEMERSQLAVEHALEAMGPLAAEAGHTAEDWASRKEVIERMLLRPFRSHRDELVVRVRESEARTKAILDKPVEQ